MHPPNDPLGRPRRVVSNACLALGVLGLWSCSGDVTGPADGPGFLERAGIQQALIPDDLTETKLTADDGAEGDSFGFSVAVNGDVAVIGARLDDDKGSSSGSAYVFERAGGVWDQIAKPIADDDGAAGDLFGSSVAVSGDVAVVGAPGDDDSGSSSGSAYVFERAGGWDQTAKLTAGHDGAAGDLFGSSVAVSGDVAVVGAPGDDDSGSSSGSAYVFERADGTWDQIAKLTAGDDAAAGDLFGSSVAVSGDVAVVGARGDDDSGLSSGSAYVFERADGTWAQVAKLTAGDDGAAGDQFGFSVAVSGGVAVVGARLDDDDSGNDSGSAYVFERAGGTWDRIAKRTAADGAAGDHFGSSVAVSGDVAVVGAAGDSDSGDFSGSAYVFERAGGAWAQVTKLTTGDDGAALDFFGRSVAVSGGVAVVGAPGDDDRGDDSGSAYVFEAPAVRPVEIDIKPGSDVNPVSLVGNRHGRGNAAGALPVAVLTTSADDGDDFDFDAATADPATITLGDGDGSDTPVAARRNGTLMAGLEDVDDDGDLDLVLHFDQQALSDNGDLDEETTELTLEGETFDGTAIRGADAVRIVGR